MFTNILQDVQYALRQLRKIVLISGIAIGAACALASSSVLESKLYGTGARNPKVIVVVCSVVGFVGLLAAYIPALRGAKVDPMIALRYE